MYGTNKKNCDQQNLFCITIVSEILVQFGLLATDIQNIGEMYVKCYIILI